jgi:gas vesicle protein
MKDILKFWAVFSIGVAAGAAVALLCAPQAGDETRKQLKKKLDDASDYVKHTASDLGDRATDVYQRGKSAVQDYSSDLADSATEALKRGKSAVQDYSSDLADKAGSAYKKSEDAAAAYSADLVDNLKSAARQGREKVGV